MNNPFLDSKGRLIPNNGPIPIHIIQAHTYIEPHPHAGRKAYLWTYNVQHPNSKHQLALLIPFYIAKGPGFLDQWMLHTPGQDPEYQNLSIPGHNSFTLDGHALTYEPLSAFAKRWIEQNSK